MGFVKHWYGGDAGVIPEPGNAFATDGYIPFDTTIPPGGTLLRTLVNIGIYSISFQPPGSGAPFDPAWFAREIIFNLAITESDGSGGPIPPLIPLSSQDGQAPWIWSASMWPEQQQWTTDVDNNAVQVVRWTQNTGTRMESFARRGPFTGDSPSFWLTWNVDDPTFMFDTNTADVVSYIGGRVQIWNLFQVPT